MHNLAFVLHGNITLTMEIANSINIMYGNTLLMMRVENCPDICFHIVNLLTSPLKLVNLSGLVGQMLENVCRVAIIIRKLCNSNMS